KNSMQYASVGTADSNAYSYAGYTRDLKKVSSHLAVPIAEVEGKSNYGRISKQANGNLLSRQNIRMKQMPSLEGMGLKDVVYLCENLGLKVNVRGRGKAIAQSINAGQSIARGQSVSVQLN
ncbi:MAG TPA: PASTA domain-containing protein, partial [Segetibacter sp.]